MTKLCSLKRPMVCLSEPVPESTRILRLLARFQFAHEEKVISLKRPMVRLSEPVPESSRKRFNIKDLGKLRFFLGLEITRSPSGILLNQHKYTLDFLSDRGHLAVNPCSTPHDSSLKLHDPDSPLYPDESAFRSLIGRFFYLTTSRPYITFAAQQLSQFVSRPQDINFQDATRVLKYLKRFLEKGLFFYANSRLKLSWFAGSDWASFPAIHCSISGYCVFIGSSLIS
ncbi:uncharacterized mitochondrial protein AtMg00810-like [Medicago truncatula]|uniref:uncharacterized mitochondrial protein AtMg00810-like n=1 Tax=Medicago truncatula TaxID=3880 RepID=UPI0019679746|nr:uncharacterized mitochondrial protein AtMg00810-like [Medicago truncatula]